MDLQRPSIQQIKDGCTEQSFARGKKYYTQGNIISVQISHSTINARVAGTQEYRVKISPYFDDLDYYCTCPYDFGGFCKHIVAVLLYASDHFDEMIINEKRRRDKIDDMFYGISAKRLREFLTTEMEHDDSLQERFMDYFGKDGNDAPTKDYYSEIDALFKRIVDSYGMIEYGNEISFDKFIRTAQIKEKRGDYAEAARIYQALSEAIADNMDAVDDSDGYYGKCFCDATYGMISCINSQTLMHQQKQWYILYMFEKHIKNDPDYFTEYYVLALEKICTSKDDHRYWKSLLEPHLPDHIPDKSKWSAHYYAVQRILMQIYILKKLNDESLDDFFAMHYQDDSNICIQYIKHLQKTGDSDRALRVMQGGLKIFPNTKLKEIACQFYEKTDPRHQDLLKELFLDTQELKYYKMLKDAPSVQWQTTVDSVIEHLTKRKLYGTLIDVFLKEGMYERAINQVISCKSLFMLSYYHNKLYKRYPESYHMQYKGLLSEFSQSRTGRDHYKKVKEHLKKMKSILGYKKEFGEFVNQLREQNSKKPAFLDELKNI